MADPVVTQITAHLIGAVITIAPVGTTVTAGSTICVVETMKLEHHVVAPCDGVVLATMVRLGDPVRVGTVLADLRAGVIDREVTSPEAAAEDVRLRELDARISALSDAVRPVAVAKRAARGLRTARANDADLIDPGSLVEYSRFAYAAQTKCRSVEELIAATPGDGLVTAIAAVGGQPTPVPGFAKPKGVGFGRGNAEISDASIDHAGNGCFGRRRW